MTTIAWDGRILAVDSRSSTPEQRPDADTEPRRARICFHCERPAWTGSDDAKKLVQRAIVTACDRCWSLRLTVKQSWRRSGKISWRWPHVAGRAAPCVN
jgi:hypothetical protein